MGKSQKKRAMRRHNPMRVPDSHLPRGLASASSTSLKTDAILPILQKIENADSVERKWACVAVSNLIQNDPSTRRLLQGKNIVGALIKRLTDSEEEVIVEATGSLRNLCIDGGYDICAEMYNKDILVPLRAFIFKISNALSQYLEPMSSPPENAQNLVYDFADNVITILWCLSETSNKALNTINRMQPTPFLMSFLAARDRIPPAPVTAAAQCLYVLTDDNEPIISEIRQNADHVSCLLDVVRSAQFSNGKASELDRQSTMLKVLCSGVLRNILPISHPTTITTTELDKDIIIPLVQPIIASTSLHDVSNATLELLSRQVASPKIEKSLPRHHPKSDHKPEEELELERLEADLRMTRLALEVLTGACATLPDPKDDTLDKAADGFTEGDNDLVMAETEFDMEENTLKGDANFIPSLPTLVAPLLALTYPTTLSFPPLAVPSPYPPITTVLSAIHINALECLNNLFLSLSSTLNPSIASDRDAGQRIWDEVWMVLGVVGTDAGLGQQARQEIWHTAVGVLWGVGKLWKGFLAPREDQCKLLMQLCDSTSDEHVRIKCIGSLECLAQYRQSIGDNKLISQYLLSMLPPYVGSAQPGTEPLIQVVSALIDIYSDEGAPYDINFRQGKYLDKLASSVEGVRKTIKGIDKRKESGRDLRRRAEEVFDNLVAFIQYRRDLGL